MKPTKAFIKIKNIFKKLTRDCDISDCKKCPFEKIITVDGSGGATLCEIFSVEF